MTAAELLNDLQQPWRHGEHVDARKIVLEEPLVLDGLEVRGFDLSEAVLKRGLSAKRTVFRGLAWLRGTEIQDGCDLTGAVFRTDFRADGLRADKVVLDRCRLEGVLSLAGARVPSVSLAEALVMANVTLEGARVDDSLDLTGAELLGGLWTAGAVIGELVDREVAISGRVRLPGRGLTCPSPYHPVWPSE